MWIKCQNGDLCNLSLTTAITLKAAEHEGGDYKVIAWDNRGSLTMFVSKVKAECVEYMDALTLLVEAGELREILPAVVDATPPTA